MRYKGFSILSRFAVLTLLVAFVSVGMQRSQAVAPILAQTTEPGRGPDDLSAADWATFVSLSRTMIQSQVAKLTADDGATHDSFGKSVSVSGDTALVGADPAAYIFYRDEGGPDAWGQVAKLTKPCESVSLSGDTALVGTGSVAYVFYRDEGGADAWGQVARLSPEDSDPVGGFGNSVSVSGDVALVGARYTDVGSHEWAGVAYVFYRDEGGPDAWGQVAKLTASDGRGWDLFGTSVSVSGDTAVVGSPGADVHGHNQGAGYVFYRDQGGADAWGQVTRLTADRCIGDLCSDEVGEAVSVNGDTAVVGAPETQASPGDYYQGVAYVYDRDEGGADAWGRVARLTAGGPLDRFGKSVSLNGDTVVVGAYDADVGGTELQGAAYVFYRDEGGAGAWVQVAKLTADDGAYYDRFGTSVSVSGDTALVGAPGADVREPQSNDVGGHMDQGAAYVYGLPEPTMHVQYIFMRYVELRPDRCRYTVQGIVRILDQHNAPVEGATVDAEWTYPSGTTLTQAQPTYRRGLAWFGILSIRPGTYQLCVTNVTKEGYVYDPDQNWETCDTITVS